MSKESAMALATGQNANQTAPQLGMTARQAARTPVTDTTTAPGALQPPKQQVNQATPPIQEQSPVQTQPDPKMDTLLKKEAELQRMRDEIKREREGLSKDKTQYENVRTQWEQFTNLQKTDPIQALKMAGFSDNDIFQAYVRAEEASKVQATPEGIAADTASKLVDDKLKEFETRQAQAAKAAQDAADKAAISNFKVKISQAINSNKDTYEFCNHYGPQATEQVFSAIEQVLKDTGEMVSIKEAIEMTENFYEEQAKELDKLKKRGYQPPQKTQNQPGAPSKTLTNRMTATGPSAQPTGRKETQAEKRERLINQIKEHGLRK